MWCFSGRTSNWDIDARLWEKCLEDAKKAMLDAGWIKHAKKFWEVQTKKANKLFSERRQK